ncbi:replication-relaxation family protein [Pseudobacillus badius]|uniref:replication-relaxation family protein n=1 Tax=Bacillus badius TaxID=1455 RepID=UPI0007B0A1FB|nr:replication-relaxation family protein [Bacillus badius]KZO00617.1 hypothetical protein A4244_14990 [Bacillus badius]OCS87858.1 hypothetical protein A6M11_15010 [Bacillus badius]OVE47188.1 hypothetical protein B1A98_18765 [Bacillus badius]TDV98986.1 protein involved in plasmid replication-relaxation [Bacillus badius]
MTEKMVIRKGRERIELSYQEFNGLRFLEMQRALTVSQYYDYCRWLLRYEITPYAFKNRLRKMEKFKLIRSGQFKEGFEGDHFKYVSIGSKGIDLLIEKKALGAEYNKKQIYSFMGKSNHYHYFATKEVIIRFLLHINMLVGVSKKGIFSYHYSKSPYIIHVPKATKRSISGYGFTKRYRRRSSAPSHLQTSSTQFFLAKPDWILRFRGIDVHGEKVDRVTNLELDTGTEPIWQLEAKVRKYIRVAQQFNHMQHQLLIVLPDETFLTKGKFSNRDKRIMNILNRFEEKGLIKDAEYAGLRVDVCSLTYAPYMVQWFLWNHNMPESREPMGSYTGGYDNVLEIAKNVGLAVDDMLYSRK